MPVLQTEKHEAFARAMAEGHDAAEAYMRIYPESKKKSAIAAAARLRKRVRERIAELQSKAEVDTLLTIKEKRQYCADVLRTPIGEITESSPLCHSVKRIEGPNGSSVEYKALDKLKALQLDNELAGHVKQVEAQAVNVTVGVAVNVMTEERRMQLLEKKRAAVERRLARSAGRN